MLGGASRRPLSASPVDHAVGRRPFAPARLELPLRNPQLARELGTTRGGTLVGGPTRRLLVELGELASEESVSDGIAPR